MRDEDSASPRSEEHSACEQGGVGTGEDREEPCGERAGQRCDGDLGARDRGEKPGAPSWEREHPSGLEGAQEERSEAVEGADEEAEPQQRRGDEDPPGAERGQRSNGAAS